MLAGKNGKTSTEETNIKREKGSIIVMALLNGGTNRCQKSWLKVYPIFSIVLHMDFLFSSFCNRHDIFF
jgi:hypothetical protein